MARQVRKPILPLAYTVDEVLLVLPIGRTKVKEMIASGELPSVLIGRKRLVLVEGVEALVRVDGAA